MTQTPYFPLSVAGEMAIIPMNKLNMYNTVYISEGTLVRYVRRYHTCRIPIA